MNDSPWSRRQFLITAGALAGVPLIGAPSPSADPLLAGITFTNVARQAGITHKTIYGGEKSNKYLLETTGCGVAFFDYDNDGWPDLYFVNGWRLEGFPKGQEPTSRLY